MSAFLYVSPLNPKTKLSVSVKIKKILYDPNLSTNLYYIETIKALEIPIFDTPQASGFVICIHLVSNNKCIFIIQA